MSQLKFNHDGNLRVRRDWHPKSSGTQGELIAVQACQDAGIAIHFFNVPIKTRFHRSTFLCDIVTCPNQTWSPKALPLIAAEIQGEFHYKTWGGRPAVRQQQKDEAKRNSLIAEGYRYCEATRREILTGIEDSERILKKASSRKTKNLPGHILLDRILRAWDDDYWFKSDFYRESVAGREFLLENLQSART